MSNLEIKNKLLEHRSWQVSDALAFIEENCSDENYEIFLKEYRRYTSDPLDSFYDSEVLAMFVDDMIDEE
jgi:hypothetical protein